MSQNSRAPYQLTQTTKPLVWQPVEVEVGLRAGTGAPVLGRKQPHSDTSLVILFFYICIMKWIFTGKNQCVNYNGAAEKNQLAFWLIAKLQKTISNMTLIQQTRSL